MRPKGPLREPLHSASRAFGEPRKGAPKVTRARVVRHSQACYAAFGAARIRAMPGLSRQPLIVDVGPVRFEVNQGPDAAWQQGFEAASTLQAQRVYPDRAEDVVDDQVPALWRHELGLATACADEQQREREESGRAE